MELFQSLKNKIKGKNIRIVFPEGMEPRILGAAVRLKADGLLSPVLLGNPEAVRAFAAERGFNLTDMEIVDPYQAPDFEEYVAAFVARRNGKVTEEQARTLLRDENYFGTMMVYLGKVDGLVSGAIHSTGDTVRPALQIIKTKPGISRTSGAFIMLRSEGREKYLFSDCAINVNPTAQELAEIAVESAKTAELFDIEPNVAMLSFSTKGSAVAKV